MYNIYIYHLNYGEYLSRALVIVNIITISSFASVDNTRPDYIILYNNTLRPFSVYHFVCFKRI